MELRPGVTTVTCHWMSTKHNGAHSLHSTQPPGQHRAVSEEGLVPWGAWQMISDVPLTPPHLVKKGTPMCAAPLTDEEHRRAPSCPHCFLHGDAGHRHLSRLPSIEELLFSPCCGRAPHNYLVDVSVFYTLDNESTANSVRFFLKGTTFKKPSDLSFSPLLNSEPLYHHND